MKQALQRLITLRAYAGGFSRFCCFLMVGSGGLACDMMIFSLLSNQFSLSIFASRLFSLSCATAFTWALNRHFTFSVSTQLKGCELINYGLVTLFAQSISFAIFSSLTIFVPELAAQLSLLIGAAISSALSYFGHHYISFASLKEDRG